MVVSKPHKLLFIPGAGGSAQFWRPAGEAIQTQLPKVYIGWEGFFERPSERQRWEGLMASVRAQLDGPTALIAQSMGGLLALRAALDYPNLVTHLVLTATSGGIDVAALGAQDWRPAFLKAHPNAPRWFIDAHEDYSARMPQIKVPVLLIWGDADPLSPVAVGERLHALLPQSRLILMPGGQHDVAVSHAAQIARCIQAHVQHGER